jgi:hypothetical protein
MIKDTKNGERFGERFLYKIRKIDKKIEKILSYKSLKFRSIK